MIRRDDGGQLMILAGIVLTLGFIMTSLTLAQVSELERQAAAEKPSPLVAEWRFLHERLATNLEVAISDETTNETFNDTVLLRVAATFRNVEEGKGYDLVIRKAEAGYARNEEDSLVTSGSYSPKARTPAGNVVTTAAYDGHNDGILWASPCPADGASSSGCIVGVYLFVRLSDPYASIEETILFAVNQD
jgi:hypothetical protein